MPGWSVPLRSTFSTRVGAVCDTAWRLHVAVFTLVTTVLRATGCCGNDWVDLEFVRYVSERAARRTHLVVSPLDSMQRLAALVLRLRLRGCA